jgi:hypothetical protein
MNGDAPVWLDNVMDNYIKPAAAAAGITKTIGWHTSGGPWPRYSRPKGSR